MPDFRQAHLRIAGCYDKVAGQAKLQATAHRVALDRGDQGFSGRAAEHPESASRGDRSLAPRYRLEIGACGKYSAGSRDDADEKFVLGIKQIHRRVHRLGRNGIEGVFCLRAIDGHDQDVAAALCEYSVHDDSPRE